MDVRCVKDFVQNCQGSQKIGFPNDKSELIAFIESLNWEVYNVLKFEYMYLLYATMLCAMLGEFRP